MFEIRARDAAHAIDELLDSGLSYEAVEEIAWRMIFTAALASENDNAHD